MPQGGFPSQSRDPEKRIADDMCGTAALCNLSHLPLH